MIKKQIVVKYFDTVDELAIFINDSEIAVSNILSIYYGKVKESYFKNDAMKHILIYRDFWNDK